MPRFVILQHVTPPGFREGTHWDLMLEQDGKLLTWSLPQPPKSRAQTTATRLPDHRLLYLEYEGPLSDNRGDVKRVASGDVVWLDYSDARIVAILNGSTESLEIELALQHDDAWSLVTSPARPRP